MGENNTAKDALAAVGKWEEPSRACLARSVATTFEPKVESYYSTQEQLQEQQKRKGGRKPIYATSEERKQRNRQAQAAFRERRTEYVKQLESTVKQHEETLQTLQKSHHSATDECLMLRHKNSLLQRIMLEKGIDVQAELRGVTDSPHLGPPSVPHPICTGQAPMQMLIMNRHELAHRSFVGFPQKGEGVQNSPLAHRHCAARLYSLHPQPTPTYRMALALTSSTKSPNLVSTTSLNLCPVSVSQQHRQPQQQPQQPQHSRPQPSRAKLNPLLTQRPPPNTQWHAGGDFPSASSIDRAGGSALAGNGNDSSAFCPSPFRNHIDQLEHEYDKEADMIDNRDADAHSTSTATYSQPFHPNIGGQVPPQHFQSQGQCTSPAVLQLADGAQSVYDMSGNMTHGFDPCGPTLDADPFGSLASMNFPTKFIY